MLLQPKDPGAKRAASDDARRRSVEARFRAAAADGGVREQVAALCAQVADLERRIAALDHPDEGLVALVAGLTETVSTLARAPWEATT
jgi:hypothetical protein